MKRSLLPIIDTRAEYIFIKTGKSWTASDASSRLEFAWPVFLSFPFFFFPSEIPVVGKKARLRNTARSAADVCRSQTGTRRCISTSANLPRQTRRSGTCARRRARKHLWAGMYTNFPLYIYVTWWPKCFVNVAKERKKKKNSERKRDTDENSPFSLRRCLKDQLRIHRIHHDSNVYTRNIISFGWWKKDPSKFARILRAKNIDRRYSPRSRGGVSIRESSSA